MSRFSKEEVERNSLARAVRALVRDRDAITQRQIPSAVRSMWQTGMTEAEIVAATGLARGTVRKHKP